MEGKRRHGMVWRGVLPLSGSVIVDSLSFIPGPHHSRDDFSMLIGDIFQFMCTIANHSLK